jgi:FMN-dependent oxidoreductase (nitrilotriacetate monooxygenase family)
MPKQIHVNLFEMNCVSHITHGMWVHPDNTRERFNDITFWTELAQLLEHAAFDAMFIADVIGAYDVFRGGPEAALVQGMQIPNNDPLMIIPAMAAVTSNLGFAATFSTTYEPPFAFARRMSTLDHLTKGRVGWNIVTSYLPNAARNFGYDDEVDHDHRYEIADEYLEVLYKLWEGSWADDAVLADKERGVYTDPAKVRYINHSGEYYRVAGPHLSQPSRQRTPVLYQAGVSDAGRSFAGKHAEAIFMGGSSISEVRSFVEDVRRIASSHGRDPDDIKFLPGASIIVGRNDEEVAKKVAQYRQMRSVDGYLAHSNSPVDWTRYDRSDLVDEIVAKLGNGSERFRRRLVPGQTVGRLLDDVGALSRPFSVAGTPKVVADEMERWVEEAGVDGFNLIQYLTPGTALDFAELVIPELRRRGLFRASYADGETLRERMLGAGRPRLAGNHPGARFRDPAALDNALADAGQLTPAGGGNA